MTIHQPKYGVLRNDSDKDYWKLEEQIHNELKNEHIKRILEYKGNKCYFCGFHDPLFIEPHHLDGDHSHNKEENIVPACTLCHRQHHLLWLAQYHQAVFGLFKDNINQTNLNHIQRILLVMNHHPDENIQKLYSRKGELGGLCFDIPISQHQRRRFTDYTDYEFQKMMCEDVKAYKNYLKANQNNKDQSSIDSVPQIESGQMTSVNYFVGEIDNIKFLERQEGEDEQKAIEKQQMFQEQLARYKDWFRNSIKDNKNFSLFQLGMALKDSSVQAYKSFTLPHILLCFKDSIFTPEQIEYYLGRPDFNLSNAISSFNNAELLHELKK